MGTTASIFGKKVETAGCTGEQLDRMIALGSEYDQLAGTTAAKDLLRDLFGLDSRKGLTKERAEEYVKALVEKIAEAKAAARLSVKSVGPYRIRRSDDRRGHKYDVFDRDGKEIAHALPGITTPLGVLDKPALLPWIANLTADAFKAKIRDVFLENPVPDVKTAREILLPLLEVDGFKLGNEQKKLGGARGTDIHSVIEIVANRYRSGEPVDDEALAVVLRSLDPLATDYIWLLALAFRDWLLRYRPKILATESMVACLHCGCAATLDLHVEIDHPAYAGEWVLDAKSPKGIYETNALQTSFQAHALQQMRRGLHERHCSASRTLRIGALWVNVGSPGKDKAGRFRWNEGASEGCEIVEFDNNQETLRTVQGIIGAYRWKRKPFRKPLVSFPRNAAEVAETVRMVKEARG